MFQIWWNYCKLAVDCFCEKSKQFDEGKKNIALATGIQLMWNTVLMWHTYSIH